MSVAAEVYAEILNEAAVGGMQPLVAWMESRRDALIAMMERMMPAEAPAAPVARVASWTSPTYGDVRIDPPGASGWLNLSAIVEGKRMRYGYHARETRWANRTVPPVDLLAEARAHGWDVGTGASHVPAPAPIPHEGPVWAVEQYVESLGGAKRDYAQMYWLWRTGDPRREGRLPPLTWEGRARGGYGKATTTKSVSETDAAKIHAALERFAEAAGIPRPDAAPARPVKAPKPAPVSRPTVQAVKLEWNDAMQRPGEIRVWNHSGKKSSWTVAEYNGRGPDGKDVWRYLGTVWSTNGKDVAYSASYPKGEERAKLEDRLVPAGDFVSAKLLGKYDRKTSTRLPGYGGYLVRYYLDLFPGIPYEHDARIIVNEDGYLYDVTGDPYDKSYTPDVPAPPPADAPTVQVGNFAIDKDGDLYFHGDPAGRGATKRYRIATTTSPDGVRVIAPWTTSGLNNAKWSDEPIGHTLNSALERVVEAWPKHRGTGHWDREEYITPQPAADWTPGNHRKWGRRMVDRLFPGVMPSGARLLLEVKSDQYEDVTLGTEPAGTSPKALRGPAAPARTQGDARKLRELGEAMSADVQRHLYPAIGDQRPTRRRASIAGNMVQHGEFLASVQTLLLTLAAAHEAGTCPPLLAGIATKAQAMNLLSKAESPTRLFRAHTEKILGQVRESPAAGRRAIATDLAVAAQWERASKGYDYYGDTTPEQADALAGIARWCIEKSKAGGHSVPWWYADARMAEDAGEAVRAHKAGLNAATWSAAKKAAETLISGAGTTTTDEQREARELAAMEREFAYGPKIPGFFATPETLADRMASLLSTGAAFRQNAEFHRIHHGHGAVGDGCMVLEPSAGSGRLALAVADLLPGASIWLYEINHGLYTYLERLAAINPKLIVAGRDSTSSPGGASDHLYDGVIMNPPFESGQDATHTRRAFDMLKHDGRLVGITGEGVFFRDDKVARAFRAWLASPAVHVQVCEKLPAGTFAESGTDVASRLLVLDRGVARPGEHEASRARLRAALSPDAWAGIIADEAADATAQAAINRKLAAERARGDKIEKARQTARAFEEHERYRLIETPIEDVREGDIYMNAGGDFITSGGRKVHQEPELHVVTSIRFDDVYTHINYLQTNGMEGSQMKKRGLISTLNLAYLDN